MNKIAVAIFTTATLLTAPALAQSQKPQTPKSSGTAQITLYNAQASNQYLASSFMGAPVKNNQNEVIGDVNDAVIDPNGKVAALVIGVGGFLGVGEKNVAVSLDSVTMEEGENNAIIVKVNASKQLLEKAEEFKPSETATTFSERWEQFQKSMEKGAQEIKKSAQEAADTMQKKMKPDEKKQQ